jgi:putative MATE family efflux protein
LDADEPTAPLVADEPAWRTVWRLAWPAVALNSLQTVNSLLDSVFVGGLPQANLTALGASANAVFLFISISFAIGTAATALVSRAFGAGDMNEVVTGARKCLGLSVWLGALLALVSLPGSALIARTLLPASAFEAQRLMVTYLGVFALALPAFFVIQSLAGSLRGVGDTKSPMVISGAQIVLHIILNFVMINDGHRFGGLWIPGLGWGLAGATTISGWAAALAYMAFAAKTPLGRGWDVRWPGSEWARRIMNIAVPAALMSVVRVTSLMAFTVVLARVPDAEAAIAALRPAFSIESLAFMPAFGLAIAASALVGQSLGMKRPDRAERLGWVAAHHAAGVSLAASVVLIVGAPWIANGLLPGQPGVARHVVHYLYYICATEVLFGYAMVFIGAMQGAGDTRRPLWLTLAAMWGLRVPMAAWLALPLAVGGAVFGLGMGADGCWLAMSVTQGVQGLASMAMFRAGAWKTVRV